MSVLLDVNGSIAFTLPSNQKPLIFSINQTILTIENRFIIIR